MDIDFFTPIPISINYYDISLVIFYILARFDIPSSILGIAMEYISRAVLEIACIFGVPKMIQSDNVT